MTVTLSAAEPTAIVRVQVDPGAAILTLDVDPSNPSGQAFLVEVTARTSSGQSVRLGSIAPFPADRPGRYTVPLQGIGDLEAAGVIEVELRLLPVRATEVLHAETTAQITVHRSAP